MSDHDPDAAAFMSWCAQLSLAGALELALGRPVPVVESGASREWMARMKAEYDADAPARKAREAVEARALALYNVSRAFLYVGLAALIGDAAEADRVAMEIQADGEVYQGDY